MKSNSVLHAGTNWIDENKRHWEIWEVLPFGKYRVRTKDFSRCGEMYGRDVRAAIAKAQGK